jgi:hypothetical protein
MSIISYPANSPYFSTPQLSWRIDRWAFRYIPPNSGDTQVTLQIQHQYRPDKLSYDLYSTPSYWWVFAVRNPFLRSDPVWDFVAGLTIEVPTLDYLRRILGG